MSESNYISIKGAKVNNLKNIDVNIPRNKLVVITGLSGSGKSSLAFDTLYAEGQRRYVESLSSYARQFLGRMSKPECDFIKGIPPAIAIEQKVNSRNPRSTVGTSTEIYEYLRLLYARMGKTYSPISGQLVKKHSIEDIVNCMLSFPKGTKYTVLTPMMPREGRTLLQQLEMDLKQGFTRIEVNREIVRIEDFLQQTAAEDKKQNIYLLVDRMTADDSKDSISRLTDSAETAMYEGDGNCLLRFYSADGSTQLFSFSTKFEADGIKFEEPNDQMFSFNSPLGACPECEGFGKVIGIDEHLVIPNREIRNIITNHILKMFKESIKEDGKTVGEFCEALLKQNPEKVESIFTDYMKKTISIRDTFVQKPTKENFYHELLLGILGFKENWSVMSNRESGDGFSDILIRIEDEDVGIVIEVKYASDGNMEKECENALQQITDVRYTEALEQEGIHKIIKYGVACYKKKCKVMMKIEE